MRRGDSAAVYALAGLLAAAGITHLAKPKPYDRIVPRALPGSARQWTYGSGVVELATAAAIAHPRTRYAGAGAAAGLFVAVFPANVKMARDWRGRGTAARTAAYARLPLQAPLVAWALSVRRQAEPKARGR
jgi:uncharacterized membrane protein